jgi:hypothetical protein
MTLCNTFLSYKLQSCHLYHLSLLQLCPIVGIPQSQVQTFFSPISFIAKALLHRNGLDPKALVACMSRSSRLRGSFLLRFLFLAPRSAKIKFGFFATHLQNCCNRPANITRQVYFISYILSPASLHASASLAEIPPSRRSLVPPVCGRNFPSTTTPRTPPPPTHLNYHHSTSVPPASSSRVCEIPMSSSNLTFANFSLASHSPLFPSFFRLWFEGC